MTALYLSDHLECNFRKEARAGRLWSKLFLGHTRSLARQVPAKVDEEALRLHHTGPLATRFMD
jgi:hypothetical protein